MPQHLAWDPGGWNEGETRREHGPPPFPLLPPRCLYERVAIGAANVGPVNKLLAFTLMDAVPEWPATTAGWAPDKDSTDPESNAPFRLFDITERHVVEGPMAAHHGPHGVEWLDHLLDVSEYLVLQRVDPMTPAMMETFYDYRTDPKAVVRIFRLDIDMEEGKPANPVWRVRDVQFNKDGTERPADPSTYEAHPHGATIDADMFHVFPFGPSVIYRAGRTIQRLLEIADGLRGDDYAERQKWLIGELGSKPAQKVRKAQDEGDRVIHLPDGQVLNLADATHAGMLLQERAALQQDLRDLTHTVLLDESVQISGRARILAMQQLLNYVKIIRSDIDQVYSAFGALVKWSPLLVAEALDRMAERDLLVTTVELLNVLDPAGAADRNARLIARLDAMI